jgi:hypothetical protein
VVCLWGQITPPKRLNKLKYGHHQESGSTTANLPTRARWLQQKLDAAYQATKRVAALLMRAFFMVWSTKTDRGDLFQIAAPAIKAMPLKRSSYA